MTLCCCAPYHMCRVRSVDSDEVEDFTKPRDLSTENSPRSRLCYLRNSGRASRGSKHGLADMAGPYTAACCKSIAAVAPSCFICYFPLPAKKRPEGFSMSVGA